MSSQDVFVCPSCLRVIPRINFVIHEAQCRGASNAPKAVPIANAAPAIPTSEIPTTNDPSLPIPVASMVPNPTVVPTPPRDSSVVVDLTQDQVTNDHEDIVQPFWPCSVCTFHNYDCSSAVCDACGSMSRSMNGNECSVPSAPPLNSHTDLPSASASFPPSSTEWQCSHCTCNNDRSLDRCQACDNVRPPQASQRDQLISDELTNDRFRDFTFPGDDLSLNDREHAQQWWSSPNEFTRVEPSSWTDTTSHDTLSRQSNSQSNNLFSSALIGAGIGAGFALLQRRNVFRGAMEGMGMGLMGGMVVNALDDTMQSASTSSSSTTSAAADSASFRRRRQLDDRLDPFLLVNQRPRTELRELHMEILQLIHALQQSGGSAGLASTEINQLPSYIYHTNSSTNNPQNLCDDGDCGSSDPCVICFESYQEGEELRLLPCDHRFHARCIDRWLQQKASCPVCKRSVR